MLYDIAVKPVWSIRIKKQRASCNLARRALLFFYDVSALFDESVFTEYFADSVKSDVYLFNCVSSHEAESDERVL